MSPSDTQPSPSKSTSRHSALSPSKPDLRSGRSSVSQRASPVGTQRHSLFGGVALPGSSQSLGDIFDSDFNFNVNNDEDLNWTEFLNNEHGHEQEINTEQSYGPPNWAVNAASSSASQSVIHGGGFLPVDINPGPNFYNHAPNTHYSNYSHVQLQSGPFPETTYRFPTPTNAQYAVPQQAIHHQQPFFYPNPELAAGDHPYYSNYNNNTWADPYPAYQHSLPQHNPQVFEGYIPTPVQTREEMQHPIWSTTQRSLQSPRRLNTSPAGRQTRPHQIASPGSMPKRKRGDSEDEEDDGSELRPVKRHASDRDESSRQGFEELRQRLNSGSSDVYSFDRPMDIAAPIRPGELPQKVAGKDHVRTNTSTRGETTRTARINRYNAGGPKYTYKPLPHGDWESGRFKFEYTRHEQWGMDELKKPTMSADQIYEYITQYPGQQLTIWIQRTPADSSRRYPTGPYDDCRFEECPNRIWANKGTIEVGSYRVAIEEKSSTCGNRVDPFDCTMYAHLYCMERFLDLPEICKLSTVRVENRDYMSKEPNGTPKFIFGPKHDAEKKIAERFVKAAHRGLLHQTYEFKDYPAHNDRGRPKLHEKTLVYAMFQRNADRPPSQMRQFLLDPGRKIGPGAFIVHMGDKEVELADKKIKGSSAFKRWRKQGKVASDFPFADHYEPHIIERINKWKQISDQFAKDDEGVSQKGKAKARNQGRNTAQGRERSSNKRNIVRDAYDTDEEPEFEGDDDDDDDDAEEFDLQRSTFHAPTRKSQRNKQRVNYNDETYGQDLSDLSLSQTNKASPRRALARPPLTPEEEKKSASHLFGTQRYHFDDYLPVQAEPQMKRRNTLELDLAVQEMLRENPVKEKKSLARNTSMTPVLDLGPIVSIMKSPRQQGDSPVTRSATRSASFNMHPVTSSKEFNADDPPADLHSLVSHGKRSSRQQRRAGNNDAGNGGIMQNHAPPVFNFAFESSPQSRRSQRLAIKGVSPVFSPNQTQQGRPGRRHKQHRSV